MLGFCLLEARCGVTGPATVVIAHGDAERLRGVEVEFLVAAVEESGGGRADGLEGQVGRTGTCGVLAAVIPDFSDEHRVTGPRMPYRWDSC